MVGNLTKHDLLQYGPFKIEIKKKVGKILFTKIYYEGEIFSLKFEEKNLDKVVDYLRVGHRKLQHDNEFVASLKHWTRQNRLLFYR